MVDIPPNRARTLGTGLFVSSDTWNQALSNAPPVDERSNWARLFVKISNNGNGKSKFPKGSETHGLYISELRQDTWDQASKFLSKNHWWACQLYKLFKVMFDWLYEFHTRSRNVNWNIQMDMLVRFGDEKNIEISLPIDHEPRKEDAGS